MYYNKIFYPTGKKKKKKKKAKAPAERVTKPTAAARRLKEALDQVKAEEVRFNSILDFLKLRWWNMSLQ